MFRISIIALLLLPLHLKAQDRAVLVMTLEEALGIARKQQPDLLNAARNVAYAQAATREAKSSYLPRLTAEADYRYNPIIQTSVLPANAFNPNNDPKDLIPIRFGTPWAGSAGLRLKQPLYEPEKLSTIEGGKLAEDLAKVQEKRILAEREEEITKAWLSILLSKARQEYAKQDLQRSIGNQELIAKRFAEGRALQNDVDEAALQSQAARIEEEKIDLDIYNAQVYLSYMMGYDTLQLIVPKESLTRSADMLALSADAGTAVSNRPDIQEQKLNTQVRMIEMRSSRASYLPTINLEGFLGGNTFTNSFNPLTNWYGNAFIGLSLRYPLYGGGEKKAKLEQSRILLEQQQQNVRKLEQQAYYEIVNARNQAEYRKKQVDHQQKRLRVQEERIMLTKARLQEGRALPQDLLEEETKLADIRNVLYRELHDYLVAVVEFRRATGLQWVSSKP